MDISKEELEAKKLVEHDRHYHHETAICESDNIGAGTCIWHFAQIRENASIGKNCIIGKDSYIDTEVKIGDRVKIENFASIFRGTIIEDHVFIGPGVIFTNDRYPRSTEEHFTLCKTHVKSGASVGANSIIIGKDNDVLEIGEHSMIGAGSIVTKNVPPFVLVVGRPAKFRSFICVRGHPLDLDIRDERNNITKIYKCPFCDEKILIKKDWIDKARNLLPGGSETDAA